MKLNFKIFFGALVSIGLFACGEETAPSSTVDYTDSKITKEKIYDGSSVFLSNADINAEALADTSEVMQNLLAGKTPSPLLTDGSLELKFLPTSSIPAVSFTLVQNGDNIFGTWESLQIDDASGSITLIFSQCAVAIALCREDNIVLTGNMTKDFLVLEGTELMNPIFGGGNYVEIFKRIQ